MSGSPASRLLSARSSAACTAQLHVYRYRAYTTTGYTRNRQVHVVGCARGMPAAAQGFLKRPVRPRKRSRHTTGAHPPHGAEKRASVPPTPRVAGELRRNYGEPPSNLRGRHASGRARGPPQSVSAASRPIRSNRPTPRVTGAEMRCPAGQDSQRPRRGRGSP